MNIPATLDSNEAQNSRAKPHDLMQATGENQLSCWEWEPDNDVVACNTSLFRLFDIKNNTGNVISKQHFLQFIHPSHVEFFHAQLDVTFQSGETAFCYNLITANGQVKTINCQITLANDTNRAKVLFGNFKEIIDQNRNNIPSNNVVNTHLHAESLAKIASWQWNPANNSFTLSANFFRLLNITLYEYDISYHNFLSFIHVDDRHKLPPLANVEKVGEKAVSVEIRMIKEGGQQIYVKSIHKLSLNDKNETVVLGTLQDISEEAALKRELEEKKLFAEMLFDRSIDLISAYDKNYNVIAWNKTCEERYGFKKEQALGREVTQLFSKMLSDPWLEDLTRALDGQFIFRAGQTSSSLEGYFDYYLLPLVTDEGEILGALSISHDLTEMRNVAQRLDDLNRSLAEKNEELERSNNELASFSYVASHDLQEPLRKIQTFSQRMLETESDQLTAPGKDYLHRMENAAKRMQTLIDDLLTFSRTSASLKNPEPTDLSKMASEVIFSLKDAIDEKDATIEIEQLPVAEVIPFQFRQLLENLISNALKYSKTNEKPHIKINSAIVAGSLIQMNGVNIDRNYLKISISDNGIGFEQQYAEKIFDLFQRLHGRHEYPGTGLGLSICKKIIQNHHGFIVADGEPGKGAVFTIYLPA